MKVIVGVENFGKIRKAEIDISNFTIFVGNNNSGKTYMMQLIYGVLTVLDKADIHMPSKEIIYEKEYLIKEEVKELEEQINYFLRKNKEQIVQQIFHKPIPISDLYIRFVNQSEVFKIKFSNIDNLVEKKTSDNITLIDRHQLEVEIVLADEVSGQKKVRSSIRFLSIPDGKFIWSTVYSQIIGIILKMRYGSINDVIFVPASRTGMLLLYKYFFAEKSKSDVEELVKISIESEHKESEHRENELGLSSPVYDFLQFLLRYMPSDVNIRNNKDIIEFVRKHLLEGDIIQVGDETVYTPQNTDMQIPLYLSSSMINEIAPLFKILTSNNRIRTIFYDEIETCLHPLKQGEMARTLIRMSNKGYRLIVSTHSDTMAAKINNLLLISKIEEPDSEKKSKMERLGIVEEDILKTDDFHAYQFINKDNGTSEVSELKFRKTPPTGYDFSLFMDSVNEIYNESSIVME